MSEYIYDINPEMVFDFVSLEGFSNAFLKNAKEEIVRCRDCKHLNIVGKCPCGFWALENLNGFCAWGERKES